MKNNYIIKLKLIGLKKIKSYRIILLKNKKQKPMNKYFKSLGFILLQNNINKNFSQYVIINTKKFFFWLIKQVIITKKIIFLFLKYYIKNYISRND